MAVVLYDVHCVHGGTAVVKVVKLPFGSVVTMTSCAVPLIVVKYVVHPVQIGRFVMYVERLPRGLVVTTTSLVKVTLMPLLKVVIVVGNWVQREHGGITVV